MHFHKYIESLLESLDSLLKEDSPILFKYTLNPSKTYAPKTNKESYRHLGLYLTSYANIDRHKLLITTNNNILSLTENIIICKTPLNNNFIYNSRRLFYSNLGKYKLNKHLLKHIEN